MPTTLHALRSHPPVGEAERIVRATDGRTLADQVELTEIPAPPFGETERGEELARRLADTGLAGARRDEAGNVLALLPGRRERPPVVLSAHLDTVFPAGTDVRVAREDGVLRAPGIGDDGRGLAVLLAVARAVCGAGIRTEAPILFAGTVGEEGEGNLRGATHLVGPNGAARGCAAFVSVDGAGLERIVHRGLGSLRLRVTVTGPGGHSWIDRGTVNPIHALARVVSRAAVGADRRGEASLTVAAWGGGDALNSIPTEAWIAVDVRAEEAEALERAEVDLGRAVRAALAEAAGRGELSADVTVLGHRPPGATDARHPLVAAARAATRAVGIRPSLAVSSTDANAAMAAGLPAIAIGGGGEGGGAHTLGEWYRNRHGPEGVMRALYTALEVAGVVADR